MPDQINQKDADQDQEIALLKHKIDDTDALAEELRQRVRELERWVGGAASVVGGLAGAITVIGIAIAANAQPAKAFVEEGMVEEPCPLQLIKSSYVTEVSVLTEEINYGSNDPTEQEILLQLSSDRD